MFNMFELFPSEHTKKAKFFINNQRTMETSFWNSSKLSPNFIPVNGESGNVGQNDDTQLLVISDNLR